MARSCNSKFEKSVLMKSLNDNENTLAKCKFKLNHPPMFQSEDMFMRTKHFSKKTDEKNYKSKLLNCSQGLLPKRKVNFHCHYEERRRRDELRRKKIIQKLIQNYKIDVEGLNEDVTREIITKTEMLEKEKRKREKASLERTVVMISRLLEEQKYKHRGDKVYHPRRKYLKSVSKTLCKEKESEKSNETDSKIIGVNDIKEQTEISDEKVSLQTITLEKEITSKLIECQQSQKEPNVEFAQKREEGENLTKFSESEILNNFPEINVTKNLVQKLQNPSCVSIEKSLESTPKCVVFQNYKKGKVYVQELKITNIGLETIHCRYLGIVVHTKSEEKFPIGIAVRDSFKLRPGLCCSTKIRLRSQDDTKELQCSVVYETRRKNNPLRHSWFFVQVTCIPVQAIIKITPLKITFPLVTWCEAKGPEGIRLLKKILRIENSGGKTCSCRISNVSLEENLKEKNSIEIEEETVSLKTESDVNIQNSKTTIGGEYPGENYHTYSFEEAMANVKIIIDELVENIFSAFLFSLKYFIEIPPFSITKIEVRFIPHYKGFHHEILFMQFENCDNCKEQAIEIVGDIKRIPLRVEPQVIDLKTCISNSGVYAGMFKIFNESKGSYSVFLNVPSSVKKHAHVHPRATTILPFNYSDFSVRIYPRVSLSKDAPKYYTKDSQVLEFPIFIHPANVGDCKQDCIKIYVFALITDYLLELSPSFINFGTVTTLETVRTELKLTNHSLALQEYGFLNLPKGFRVEPNMGFGRILPKESISLYLLFSPGSDLLGYDNTERDYEFQIAVTSVAEYGGFREKLESEEWSEKSFEQIWVTSQGEDDGYELKTPEVKSYWDNKSLFLQAEDSEDFDACEEEDSSMEGEELCEKIQRKENEIREFLKRDDTFSVHSFFKRMDSRAQDHELSKGSEDENCDENLFSFGEYEESEKSKEICANCNLNVVNCRAFIVQPRCQISESWIQLPATPCSSFSLYRFRLNANNKAGDGNCFCDFRKISKQHKGKLKFQGSFEFQYFCPHIKLEPESGFIKAGDNVPITVIYRPEFPVKQLRQEARTKKVEKHILESKAQKISPNSKSEQGQSKPSKMKPSGLNYENSKEDILNVSHYELESYDLFAGERSLQELMTPFHVETKLRCLIKTTDCSEQNEKIEIHEIMLVCPAIKPNFIYLGNSQEINFNKVFIGTKSKVLLQVQNISFERITPSITLLNPLGAFYCSAETRKVLVDPEHIWQQPLIYAPLKSRGIEKQFFEIYCGSTNISLSVSGEGIYPEYKITPNFAFCLMEVRPEGSEVIKLDIENLSSIKMNVFMRTEFVKEGPDLEKDNKYLDETKSKKEKSGNKEESKDKKKSKTSESGKNFRFWDEISDEISSELENFIDLKVNDLTTKVFNLAGLNDDNEVTVPPSGRQQIKIQAFLSEDKRDKKCVVKYSLMLEKTTLLKEIIVMAKIFKGK